MPQKVQLVRDKLALSKNDLMKAKLFILVSRDHDIHLRYPGKTLFWTKCPLKRDLNRFSPLGNRFSVNEKLIGMALRSAVDLPLCVAYPVDSVLCSARLHGCQILWHH